MRAPSSPMPTMVNGSPKLWEVNRSALKIAGAYLIVGCLWILASDAVVSSIASDVVTSQRFQTGKGWFFVITGSVLLYLLVRWDLHQYARSQRALRVSEARFRESAEHRRSLLSELDHRVRNNLASMDSLVDLYIERSADVEQFAQSMRGMIRAMVLVHETIATGAGQPAPLATMWGRLTAQLPTSMQYRITLNQPEAIRIASCQVAPVMLVLHELLANSARTGALSQPAGRLTLHVNPEASSASAPSHEHRLVWVETDVVWPDGEAGCARTPGFDLATGFVEYALQGSLHCEPNDSGMRITLTFPVSTPDSLKESSAVRPPSSASEYGRSGSADLPVTHN